MLKLNVRKIVVRDSGFNDKSGKPSQEQLCDFIVDGKYLPLECRMKVGPNGPLPVGFHDVDPESFQQGKFGRIEIYPRALKK